MALAHHTSAADEAELHRNLAAAVRTLRAIRGMTATELASAVSMTSPALSERMSGKTAWRAVEVLRLARVFDVDPGLLYLSPEALEDRLKQSGYKSAGFSVVPVPESQMEIPFPSAATEPLYALAGG